MMIAQPGDYVTRDGRRVTVREISSIGTYCVKGAIWKQYRGKLRPRGHSIWTISGAYRFVDDPHPADLVGVWPSAVAA